MVSHKDVNYVTKNTARCNYTPYIMYARQGVAVKRHTVCRKEKSVTESHRKRADAKEGIQQNARAGGLQQLCVDTDRAVAVAYSRRYINDDSVRH